jgi:hypothetical protein
MQGLLTDEIKNSIATTVSQYRTMVNYVKGDSTSIYIGRSGPNWNISNILIILALFNKGTMGQSAMKRQLLQIVSQKSKNRNL